MTAWNWTPSPSWAQLRFFGDKVAAGTSPSAVQVGENNPHVFFVDATQGESIAPGSGPPSTELGLSCASAGR